MYKGIPIAGKYFFALLYSDPGFCQQLGRVVLATGRLETELNKLLAAHSGAQGTKRATLGALLRLTMKKDLLNKMQPVLEMVKDQRNYLTHNVYALLSIIHHHPPPLQSLAKAEPGAECCTNQVKKSSL